jgi:hypothetical protein
MAIFYLDYELGNDATTATPLGWWSVAYTGGTAPQPVADELATGATSGATAKLTTSTLTSGTWAAGTAAGTLYFYGKSVTAFVAEQVNFAGGGHAHILVDLTYCAWKTTTLGATAARIAAGDIIRIKKSEDPTSLGCNGTWTEPPNTMTTAKAITGSTNASPIQITCTSHGYSTGDIVHIYGDTTNFTANGTWTITYVGVNTFTLDGSSGVAVGTTGNSWKCPNQAVHLATPQTATITRCEQVWTADNASTVTADTAYKKEGWYSAKVVKASPANSTLYAHFATGTLNLSSYQKISFWIKNDTAVLVNQWNICLCSDTAGSTIVDTFAIPAIPSVSQFLPLTLARNGGGNLGNSIQSIAIYSGSSAGATTGITLDNFIACTTSGLNLQSLISKNTTAKTTTSATGYANESWYAIQSISQDGTVLRLDNTSLTNPTTFSGQRGGGYYGATETVTTYKRETTKTALVTLFTDYSQEVMDSGSAGSPIQFQGSYDPATNLQTGETIFDGLNGFGYGLMAYTSRSYDLINYISFYRYSHGIALMGSSTGNLTIDTCPNCNCNQLYGVYLNATPYATINTVINAHNNGQGCRLYNASGALFGSISTNNNETNGIHLEASNTITGSNNVKFVTINAHNNNQVGLYCDQSHNSLITTMVAHKNYTAGVRFYFGCNHKIYNLTANYNQYALYCYGGAGGSTSQNNFIMSGSATGNWTSVVYTYFSSVYLNNFTYDGTFASMIDSYAGNAIYSSNHNGVAGTFYQVWDVATISSDITNRHTASGICWKMSPTSAVRTVNYPLKLKVATIAVAANATVTAKVWVKKDHATNINAVFVLPGLQIAGVDTDVTDVKVNDTNYEQLVLTFTPTAAGVVEFYVYAYGGTTNNVYVDDFTITQQ